MYHTEPPTDKTIREWYMNSSRVTACSFRSAHENFGITRKLNMLKILVFVTAVIQLLSTHTVPF